MSEADERREADAGRETGGHAETVRDAAEADVPMPVPRLYRNYVSFAGMAIAAAGLVSIVLMLMLDFFSNEGRYNPYVGIFTYILFPSVMGFGLLLIPVGMLWGRRRRRRLAPSEIGRYPSSTSTTLDAVAPSSRSSCSPSSSSS
jgi:hypothetical protein